MSSPIPVLQAMDIAKLITHTIDSATDYLKTREIEKTERERVVACLNAIAKKIEVDRKNFETFISISFEERERLYMTMDKIIQNGLQNNDLEMIKFASQVMLNVYNKNPLEGFKDVSQGIQLEILKPIRNYIEN